MADKRLIGRLEELRKMESLYSKKGAQLIVVYGRRRVGKSTLLKHFCQGKANIFFTGRKDETRNELLGRLLWDVGEYFRNPLLGKLSIRDWKEVFEIIDLENSKARQKLIIVLDEFQWMCSGKKSDLLSALQEHWDNKWNADENIFLVLCGSIVSFMEKNILSQKSPLYGRRTASFELEPMNMLEARLFFPRKGVFEQAQIIMTLGGIPSYMELINPKESFAQNINTLALVKESYFTKEIEFILREQLKNPGRYYLILKHLARTPLSRDEVAKKLGIGNSGALDLYLKTLTDLHLVKHQIPITKNELSKKVRYGIWDEFLRFYFFFIHPNMERIGLNTDGWLFDKIVLPKLEIYNGYSFELFCRKNLKILIKLLGIEDVFSRSGVYWQTETSKKEGVQIDMVIERSDATIHLVECKWSNGKIGSAIIDEINRKKNLFPNKAHYTVKTLLITTHGATDEVVKSGAFDDVITVKDMVGV